MVCVFSLCLGQCCVLTELLGRTAKYTEVWLVLGSVMMGMARLFYSYLSPKRSWFGHLLTMRVEENAGCMLAGSPGALCCLPHKRLWGFFHPRQNWQHSCLQKKSTEMVAWCPFAPVSISFRMLSINMPRVELNCLWPK